jgi:xanthine dehydrogenase accessory factor
MRDIIDTVDRWHREGKQVAVATVVNVWGSAPRPVGSRMAISSSGEMEGSVSGGCVEAAVFDAAQRVLDSGEPALLTYGVSDEQAWAVGLSCGGNIEIFLERLAFHGDLYRAFAAAVTDDRSVALATALTRPFLGKQLLIQSGGPDVGHLGTDTLDAEARERAAELLKGFRCEKKSLKAGDAEVTTFVEAHGPRPKLVIVGAVHVAIPLIRFAKLLGYRTVVVDPRVVFATPERFGHADELLLEWPDEAFARVPFNETTYLVLLSHDLRIDLPALAHALRSGIPYIGALGSKKTQKKRIAALEADGFTAEDISRIHAPIGIDLGGRRAEEIALGIMAEIVAVSHGVSGHEAAPRADFKRVTQGSS